MKKAIAILLISTSIILNIFFVYRIMTQEVYMKGVQDGSMKGMSDTLTQIISGVKKDGEIAVDMKQPSGESIHVLLTEKKKQ